MRLQSRNARSILRFLSATLGVLLGMPGVAVGFWPAAAKEPLPVRLDPRGPYLILATEKASRDYAGAVAKAKALHPDAASATFDPAGDLDAAGRLLRAHRPRYALLFILPDELDVNFAWQWLTLCTRVDDDPLVDVRTGFITGHTPRDAEAFVDRIAAAAAARASLPGKFVDNLGPNTQARKNAFTTRSGNFVIPVLGKRLGMMTISHGAGAFTDERLGSMSGAGLLHFGGHGHPDRIDDGLRGTQARALRVSPCVAFNGACYTAVTGRWYDQWTKDGKVAGRTVDPADSFCLNFLKTDALAYLAALHPDHGVPVYQEIEFLAYSGASLGDVMKHTHDGVAVAGGGRLPAFERLTAGMPRPAWTPADVMLKGTAARVLFGDPSMIVTDAFTEPPFAVVARPEGDSLRVTATLANPSLKSTYTDTYFADLAADKNLFNDRALIVAELPEGWESVKAVEVVRVEAKAKPLKHRLVGFAVEQGEHPADGAAPRRLHVQVDVESDGYMRSALRARGATVELTVTH